MPIKDSLDDDKLCWGEMNLTGQKGEELATFGAGCYWGTEKYLSTIYERDHPGSILGSSVGFMSPNEDAIENPLYKDVKKGNTTHVEVLQIRFNNTVTTYEELVRSFFTFHDPTIKNKQGNDKGTQYASTIFYHSDEQKQTAEKVLNRVQDLVTAKKITNGQYKSFKVTTAIINATTYYPAHLAH